MGEWHDQTLRVRFEETDTMQVVYYGKFLIWFEVGRVALLRDIGMPYSSWASKGFHIPVVQAHADYRASAHFDDEVLVRTKVTSVGNSSMRFDNEVYKLPEKKLLCTGHTIHALIGSHGRAVKVPDDLKAQLLSS